MGVKVGVLSGDVVSEKSIEEIRGKRVLVDGMDSKGNEKGETTEKKGERPGVERFVTAVEELDTLANGDARV